MSPYRRFHPEFHPVGMDEQCGAPHVCEIPHSEAGAGDGTRTRTGLPPTVFKTVASAISPLRRAALIIACRASLGNTATLHQLA